MSLPLIGLSVSLKDFTNAADAAVPTNPDTNSRKRLIGVFTFISRSTPSHDRRDGVTSSSNDSKSADNKDG